MVLDWKRKSDAEYDSLNFWNFLNCLGLNVKTGTFSLNASEGQQLSLSECVIHCVTGFTEVSWLLSQCFDLCVNNKVMFLSVMPMRDSLRAHPYTNNDCLYKELSS